MVKFDMSLKQNFAQFKSDLYKYVFVENWGDGLYELFVETENESKLVKSITASTDEELNRKLSQAYRTYTTSSIKQ